MKRVISIVYLLWLFSLFVIASTINIEKEIRKSIIRVNDTINSTYTTEENKDTECNIQNCLTCKNDKCVMCIEEFVLQENKCFNEQSLDEFISGLKLAASPKEKSVLDYVIKNMINIPKNQNQNQKINNDNNKTNTETKFRSLAENFNEIKEVLSSLQAMNERECRMKINEFVVGFEENMQVLMSLANLFEQKTIFEIEKQRNSIFQILKSETIDPNTKLEVISNKMKDLTGVILDTFKTITNKIEGYENISSKKIQRAKNSFMIKIKKFLN